MPPQNSIDGLDKHSDIESKTKFSVVTQKDDSPPAATVVVPPDGGWGWVVMMASFCCNVVVDGIVFSAGMFVDPIRFEFNASKARVALVCSLLSGFYLLAGPFVSGLANRYGFRPVTIVGAIISSFAFGISYFATSVTYLYLSYGVLGGIGFCFIYMPSVITVGYYFERWRALATGISLCGSGIGTFIFAPLSSYLITEYGWRGALLVQSGIILLCAVFGSAFRPLQPVQVTLTDPEGPESKKLLGTDGFPVIYTKPLPEGRFAYSVPNSVHNTWIGANNNTQYPTAAEVFRGSGANLERRPSAQSGNVSTAVNLNSTSKKLEHLAKRMSGLTPEDTIHGPNFNQLHELNTVGEAEEENENGQLLEDKINAVAVQGRRHTVSGRRPNDVSNSRSNSRRGTIHDSRPLYRDDIFFSGSLVRIPQYQSQTSLGYHMSVTRVPTQHDVDEEETSNCQMCPEAVRRTLATMLDMSLLKSPAFMLLALSGFCTMMGFFVPFTFIVQRAKEGGMDEKVSLYIISAIGISNTVARIVCGIISSLESVNALHINNVAITIGGIATMISGFYITEAYQFTYAAIFGIAIACFSALRSILVVDLMGLEKLTNAFGILMLFQGLAAVMGTPIAGLFMDATGSYDASFYLSGFLMTLSAVLCYPLNYVSKWEKRRTLKQNSKPKPNV